MAALVSSGPPRTERLRLREYTHADESSVFNLFADEAARVWYPEMSDPASARQWIERNLLRYRELGFGLWAMELAGGEFIGDCGLTYQQVEGGEELEIGYHVIASERGRGYATEAARACLNFGFTHTASSTICSIVRPANQASRAVAGRIHSSHREFILGKTPALLFSTTRQEWAQRRRY